MEFIVDFNNKLIKRMFFYKNFSKEGFNYKKFSSNKSLIHKIVLEGCFKTKVIMKKKNILKKNIILQLLTNNKSDTIYKKKSDLKIKKKTIINIKNELSPIYLDNFVKRWFFLFNPFFFENEIVSLSGPKSIKKNIDSFKTIRLLNSRLISSSLFNFEISLKIYFYQEDSSEVFFSNYEC
jgi:hypothetical protein